MTDTCSVPGCGVALSPRTTSGVCRAHNHVPGHCRCASCRRRLDEFGEPRAECSVPGCGAKLRGWGESGVCRDHLHAPGHCRCRGCREAAGSGVGPLIAEVSRMPPRAAAERLAAYWREVSGA